MHGVRGRDPKLVIRRLLYPSTQGTEIICIVPSATPPLCASLHNRLHFLLLLFSRVSQGMICTHKYTLTQLPRPSNKPSSKSLLPSAHCFRSLALWPYNSHTTSSWSTHLHIASHTPRSKSIKRPRPRSSILNNNTRLPAHLSELSASRVVDHTYKASATCDVSFSFSYLFSSSFRLFPFTHCKSSFQLKVSFH